MLLAQMTGLNYDGASAAASLLRETLLPACYFFCFLGFVECVYHSRGDGERIILFFISVACIVVLASNFPAGITLLQTTINGWMETRNEHQNNMFYQMLNANLGETPSIWDVGNYILYGIVKLLQGIGRFGIIIIELIQSVSILALVGISPILIGFLATSWTRSAGVRFLLTSLIVCMWSIGIALVDLVLFSLGQYIFSAAIGAGGVAAIGAVGAGTAAGLTLTTLAMPALLLLMAVACCVPLALYLAIPLIMGSVFLGANPITSALSAGSGLAATGIGIAAASAVRSISTAAGMAARAPAAAACRWIVHEWRQRIMFGPTTHGAASAKHHSAVDRGRRRECVGWRSRQTRRRRLYSGQRRVIQLCARRPSSRRLLGAACLPVSSIREPSASPPPAVHLGFLQATSGTRRLWRGPTTI